MDPRVEPAGDGRWGPIRSIPGPSPSPRTRIMPMNLPNLLTLSRIVAIPLVILTFYLPAPFGPWAGCVLFAAAGVTDWLDGQLARRWHQQSAWGRVLDPIADKLLVATILFMLAALQRISPV